MMVRGDGSQFIFNEDSDALLFLKWLSEVCESHGWNVHAWVLMGNHFVALKARRQSLVGELSLD